MQLRSAKKEKATSSSNAHNLKTAEVIVAIGFEFLRSSCRSSLKKRKDKN